MGLTLMAERARALGGDLAAGPVDDGVDGWQVAAELPLVPQPLGALA